MKLNKNQTKTTKGRIEPRNLSSLKLWKMTTEMISVTKDGEFTVQGVYVNPEMFVEKSQKLFSLKDVSSKVPLIIKAPSAGKILRILVQSRAKVVKG